MKERLGSGRLRFTSFRFLLSSSSYSVMLQVRLTSNLAMGRVDLNMWTGDDILGYGRDQGGGEGQE